MIILLSENKIVGNGDVVEYDLIKDHKSQFYSLELPKFINYIPELKDLYLHIIN